MFYRLSQQWYKWTTTVVKSITSNLQESSALIALGMCFFFFFWLFFFGFVFGFGLFVFFFLRGEVVICISIVFFLK